MGDVGTRFLQEIMHRIEKMISLVLMHRFGSFQFHTVHHEADSVTGVQCQIGGILL